MQRYEDLNKSFINGEWTEGLSERTYDILNPYDNSVINTVRLATTKQLEETFETAKQAQKQWAKSSAEERKAVLRKAADYLKDNREAIVDVVVRETGGTIIKGHTEVQVSIDELEEAIIIADELYQVREVPSIVEGKVNHVHRLPLGVISSISPFNFPMNLSMRTIAPAIALGNSVVHKPDIQVGLSGGSMIAKAFEEAGLPKGVFNMILTDLQEIGDEMLTNPVPGLISFTGSTPVGRHIGKIAGENLKRVALELGGNGPFVILSDADVDRAVDAAVFGKFLHQGQICMITNRIIVHQDKYDEFVQKFVERVKALPYGDPRDPKTVIGPLVNERQLEKAVNVAEEAIRDGEKVALEGERIGNVLTPYVFIDVKNSSKLAQTEVFAPIATIIKAETDEEAIDIANDTDYGLASAIFTSDLVKGEELALQIDAGMTHVNDQTVNAHPNLPFGGNKASGLGRFGSPWIIEEFTVTKWVSIQHKYRKFPF
ncbi:MULTISPECIES: aldehyde dehydrogenase family protein [unclassified Bacillus (in: firmicutes)]|uniref:aldehyde dehydrogenase family protein n=1 Tax=unclassified Bacillus (in: firmicutes) TaxID=185979 RepID=UPI000E3EBCF3|nr:MULTISPECIES: aldehyde dehydrogenase family protein [unclassified Bacillus (in: firmicutes)]RFU63590.1 aldehyde dehydrogenase family protein [Bacillus sp. V59.32b]CAH0345368.1 Putative aldehyde dehydrogenase AldY [Bacillus sp. CECT 9360]